MDDNTMDSTFIHFSKIEMVNDRMTFGTVGRNVVVVCFMEEQDDGGTCCFGIDNRVRI